MKIEELLNKRKRKLDIETPPGELWQAIRDDWKNEPKPTYYNWWKVAAILLMICSLSLLGYNLSLQNRVEKLASLGDISEKYEQLEKDYLSQISAIEEKILIDKVKQQEDYSWIFDELSIIEKVNDTYRADLGKGVNDEQLVQVLIDYYEKRLRLLKKLELEIKRTQNQNRNEKNLTRTINS